MQRLLVILALCFALAAQGCASIQDMNPFTTRPLNPAEVTYGQFSNIPLPKDMTPVARRSFTNYAPDGAKNGLETLEGNVEQADLTRAMVTNMVRDGWALRVALSGAGRDVQVYEQQNTFAVIYYYRQTTTTAMEVWVGSRLADGTYQLPPQAGGTGGSGGAGGGYAPASPSSAPMNAAPARGAGGSGGGGASGGSGDLQERTLP